MLDALSLTILVSAALLPTVLVTVAMLHVNRRLSAENRDLLKAVLALSGKPEGAQLAGALHATDHAATMSEARPREPQAPSLRQVR